MLQDIQPSVYDNAYRQETPDADSRIMFIRDGAVLVRESEEGISFPAFGELEPEDGAYTYLFSIDSTKYFLAAAVEPQGGYEYLELYEFRHKKPKDRAFAAGVAGQLHGWYARSRFCGRCGNDMEHDKKERMMRCGCCGNLVYPRISPAVIVGVTDGDRLLMTRYAGRIYKRYALIAGFAEVGETIEETVKREVMEEAGVRVKNLKYYKSQPWPFSGSLLMGFFCELDGPDTIVLDKDELDEALWVRREDIDVQPDDVSLTNEMIVYFRDGMPGF
jgi:NAD+ diphosphatase